MSDFWLIHGSCHGAWCWRDVIPALAALGHSARAIDLPGHGDDTTPIDGQTLPACAQKIVDALDRPSIVIGHSWGGYPITAAAELDNRNILGLGYLCAYTPYDGMSLGQMRQLAARQPIMHAVRVAEDGLTYTIDPDEVQPLFYHDCPPDAVAYAAPRLCPQAVLPQRTPLAVTGASAGLPRHYILCRDDRTIPPEFQDEMAANFPAEARHELPTSHSPFFADPAGLATVLDKIAKSIG